MIDFTCTHFWYWRKWLGHRHNHPCRVLARGAFGSVLVEFGDGYRVIAPRFAVRRIREEARDESHH